MGGQFKEGEIIMECNVYNIEEILPNGLTILKITCPEAYEEAVRLLQEQDDTLSQDTTKINKER